VEPFSPGILHPTDFSDGSRVAFAHALAIALARKTKLTLLNAGGQATVEDWQKFPPVRATLERWGLLEEGSSRGDVFAHLQVKVKKVAVDSGNPGRAILDYLGENPYSLIVLATEQRAGRPAFLEGSVAGRVARASRVNTLFIPGDCRGFVSPEDGKLSLRRSLVPVDHTPDPQPAIERATWAAHWLGIHPVAIHLLHVGLAMPEFELPADLNWTWETSLCQGDPVDEILAAARELPADLILMSTDGRDGFLDLFRGSHSERVVRAAPCPVGAIAVG
jgi:nucleotide-binding universal stress UspA family protein